MRPIVINGTVLCDNITGIPRYVYEVVSRLDKLLEGTGLDVRLAYRDDGRPLHLTGLKNIQVVPLHAVRYCYNLFVLPHYLRKNHAFFVGLASDLLMTRDSAVVLHDIRPLVMDTDRGFFRFKFWVHCLSTKWFAQEVYTVSDDQRHLISDKLGIPLDKIGVTYNGWEHMNAVEPDESVFEKLPDVKKGEYFYALGSLAKHKNYKWIREVAARLAGADDFIRRLPDGYNTMLTGNGANLSQGQRQLLAIARAAVADPPVMIMDEATSSIDTHTEAIVQRGMDALMTGRTTFVIAHRLSTVQNADAIMVLDHGRIIERGTHDQLIAQHGTYYQLYTGALELD